MRSAESSTCFAIAFLNFPNWWLAVGTVQDIVWRSPFGNDYQLIINDFDTAFLGQAQILHTYRQEELNKNAVF